eukprot:1143010-Prorocentrum_minimum.AAC.1
MCIRDSRRTPPPDPPSGPPLNAPAPPHGRPRRPRRTHTRVGTLPARPPAHYTSKGSIHSITPYIT